MKPSPFKLERYFARYEFSAPYLLCSSDCQSISVQELLAYEPEAEQGLKNLWLGYTESAGHPDLRQQISKLYENIWPPEVLVHSGAEEAIFNFMNVALEPGDNIIVHCPCYQSLTEVAEANGCSVTRWETYPTLDWEIDPDFLKKNIRPETKGIVINCPHNPTGYLMSRAKLEQIVEITRDHNLWLFSDEVYRGLEYDERDRLPSACDLYENAVSLGVMSKSYGLAGLRIGWLATRNKELYGKLAAFKDYLTICNSAPSEYLATLALRHGDALIKRNLGIIKTNLALLDDFFNRWQAILEWRKPKAGAIAFPSLKIKTDIEDFCRDLVEQKGVMLLPGSLYDYHERHFRLGFGRSNMPEALAHFDEYLKSL